MKLHRQLLNLSKLLPVQKTVILIRQVFPPAPIRKKDDGPWSLVLPILLRFTVDLILKSIYELPP